MIALKKIVELGSFTKAADKLGYTQSAVSQMIASLEEVFSIKLLYRSRIDIRLTLEGELRAVVPADHRLSARSSVTLEELSKEPFLLLEEGNLSEPLEAFRQLGLEPNITLRVHDDYSILSMIETGLGISILPELVLRKTNYEVAILPIEPAVTRKIGLVMKETHSLPIACKHFIAFLMNNSASLP